MFNYSGITTKYEISYNEEIKLKIKSLSIARYTIPGYSKFIFETLVNV